jgi:hypothetical protein
MTSAIYAYSAKEPAMTKVILTANIVKQNNGFSLQLSGNRRDISILPEQFSVTGNLKTGLKLSDKTTLCNNYRFRAPADKGNPNSNQTITLPLKYVGKAIDHCTKRVAVTAYVRPTGAFFEEIDLTQAPHRTPRGAVKPVPALQPWRPVPWSAVNEDVGPGDFGTMQNAIREINKIVEAGQGYVIQNEETGTISVQVNFT